MKPAVYFLMLSLTGTIGAQLTVAVADFQNQSGVFHLDSWEKSVAEYLKTDLSRSEELILVERENIGAVLKEQALGQTGLLDPAEAQAIGGLLGARYVITGIIMRNSGQIDIHAQIIQVTTGQMRSERVSAPDDQHFSEMVQLLSNNIRFNLIGSPGYQTDIRLNPCPTGYFLGATVLFAAGTLFAGGAYQKELADYRSAADLADFDAHYDAANRLYHIRNALAVAAGFGLAGTLYCWIRNRSAGEITAGDQPLGMKIIPGFSTDFRSCYAGVTVRF